MSSSSTEPPSSDSESEESPSFREYATERLSVLGILVISVVADLAFLAAWVLCNWVVDRWVITPHVLEGVDADVLTVARHLFAWITLTAVVLFALEDIISLSYKMIKRLVNRFR
jgi:hypothetical protein